MTERLTFTIAALLASGLALGADFNEVDADSSGEVSTSEFYGYAGDAGLYDDFDMNDDDFIDESEFGEFGDAGFDGDFDTWDTNDDNYLDSNEFYAGTFDYYDDDESGHWNETEWDDVGEAGILDF